MLDLKYQILCSVTVGLHQITKMESCDCLQIEAATEFDWLFDDLFCNMTTAHRFAWAMGPISIVTNKFVTTCRVSTRNQWGNERKDQNRAQLKHSWHFIAFS